VSERNSTACGTTWQLAKIRYARQRTLNLRIVYMKNVTVRIDRRSGWTRWWQTAASGARRPVTASPASDVLRSRQNPTGRWFSCSMTRNLEQALSHRTGIEIGPWPRDHSLPARRWNASLRRPKYKNGPQKSGPFTEFPRPAVEAACYSQAAP